MLYQQSLSGAFQAMADVYSALSGAVGAADKVIELMHRESEVGVTAGITSACGLFLLVQML